MDPHVENHGSWHARFWSPLDSSQVASGITGCPLAVLPTASFTPPASRHGTLSPNGALAVIRHLDGRAVVVYASKRV